MPCTSTEGIWFTAPMTHTTSARPDWRWLASTRKLQSEYFGVSYGELTGEKLVDYMRTQIAAIASELGEFSQEVDWKPWVNAGRDRGWVNREAAVGELVDLAHFVANALCALGVTDEEWEERYQAKQQVNRDRRASGYDARSGKCECGRAYEDGTPTQDYDLKSYTTVPGIRCVCGKFHPRS